MADKTKMPTFDDVDLPYSLETEQAVIGSILINPECVTQVLSHVKPDYFYIAQHKEIMDAVMILDTLGSRIDALTVLDKLSTKSSFDVESGKNYLFQLAQMVPSAANVENYCKIVREKYFLRSLIAISKETIASATDGGAEADKILDSAEQKIYDIRKGRATGSIQRLSEVISAEVYPNLVKISSENAEEYKGIPTGFSKLDEITSGLNRSDLVLIGARPAMGKTSFALNLALNISMAARKKTVIFSLEMSKEQLAERLLASQAGVTSQKFRTGELTDDEWVRVGNAASQFSDVELYLDDSSSTTVPEIKSKIRRLKNVDAVVIDYLGLIKGVTHIDNRNQEISEITRNLKMMAKDLNIPVICCAQLSRASEGRGKSHKPQLSDLRDSGSIEQDADIIMFLFREEYYKNEVDEDKQDDIDDSRTELIVAKNRHGQTGSIELAFDKEFTRFRAVDNVRDYN